MTGEITLRGRVLPIGGLKEKALAARRLGIKTVIMPSDNANELPDLPDVLKNEITFVPVKRVDEVFDIVLEGGTAFEQYKTEEKKVKPRKRTPKTLPVIGEQPTQRDSVRCK